MAKSYTGGLNFLWPVKKDTDWDGTADSAMTKVSGHGHTGSGDGKLLTAAAFAADALNGSIFRLSNNQALRGRNAANSADINLFRLDTSDLFEIMRVARFSSTETLVASGAISTATSLTVLNGASLVMTLAAGAEGQLKYIVNINTSSATVTGIGSVPGSGGMLSLVYLGGAWRATRSLRGVNTNDDALTGEVGEVLRTTRLRSAATAISPSGTTVNVCNPTSITLTPGDWDVRGSVGFLPAATTNVTLLQAAVSKTTAALPAADTLGVPTAGEYRTDRSQAASVPTADIVLDISSFRVSVSANTPIFLVARATFTVSTMTTYGFLEARRIR